MTTTWPSLQTSSTTRPRGRRSLDPTADLAASTTYTATVKGGAAGVKDSAGNPLAADKTWSFTTAAPPPPPPTEGPGGPILVLSSSSNPFGRYTTEILRTEGLNEFAAQDVSTLSSTTLAAHDVVVLGETQLTDGQVTLLSDWVNEGGNLIALRPDKRLAGLLGLTDAAGTLANAYLRVDTVDQPGRGITGETIQFHGTADRYTPQWRHSCGFALHDGDGCRHESGSDVAERRLERRRGGRIHLRPRPLDRADAAGKSCVGRPVARRSVRSDPLGQLVLRQRLVRSAARLGRPEQGRDPSGRRAAAAAGQPHPAHESRPASHFRASGTSRASKRRPL